MTRYLPDSTELRIFKSIASASLTPEKNVSLTLSSDDAQMTEDKLLSVFNEGWSMPWVAIPDTTRAAEVRSEIADGQAAGEIMKVKVKSSKKEYLSGGTIYTMSNGLKVVVKP